VFRSTALRPSRRMLLIASLAAAAATLVLPSIANADPAPTTVKLSQNAVFEGATQLVTEVTLNCTPGWGYNVNVSVVQPQGFGFTMFAGGWASGQCTGQQQKLAVPVYPFNYYGTWLLGDASASVVACAGLCADDTKQIKIGL
jgi:hypothetical protein